MSSRSFSRKWDQPEGQGSFLKPLCWRCLCRAPVQATCYPMALGLGSVEPQGTPCPGLHTALLSPIGVLILPLTHEYSLPLPAAPSLPVDFLA